MEPQKTRKEGQNPKNPKKKRKLETRTIYLYYKEQRRREKRYTSNKKQPQKGKAQENHRAK